MSTCLDAGTAAKQQAVQNVRSRSKKYFFMEFLESRRSPNIDLRFFAVPSSEHNSGGKFVLELAYHSSQTMLREFPRTWHLFRSQCSVAWQSRSRAVQCGDSELRRRFLCTRKPKKSRL